jgi:hypothetical protein
MSRPTFFLRKEWSWTVLYETKSGYLGHMTPAGFWKLVFDVWKIMIAVIAMYSTPSFKNRKDNF